MMPQFQLKVLKLITSTPWLGIIGCCATTVQDQQCQSNVRTICTCWASVGQHVWLGYALSRRVHSFHFALNDNFVTRVFKNLKHVFFTVESMPVVYKVKHFSRGGQHHLNSSFYPATKIGIFARRKSFQLEKCFQLGGKQFCYTGFKYKIVLVQDIYQ